MTKRNTRTIEVGLVTINDHMMILLKFTLNTDELCCECFVNFEVVDIFELNTSLFKSYRNSFCRSKAHVLRLYSSCTESKKLSHWLDTKFFSLVSRHYDNSCCCIVKTGSVSCCCNTVLREYRTKLGNRLHVAAYDLVLINIENLVTFSCMLDDRDHLSFELSFICSSAST